MIDTIQHAAPDLSYLQSVSNGDQKFEAMLINTSIKSIDSKMIDLMEGVNEKDTIRLRKAVHAMKPLFAVVGFPQLQAICGKAEEGLAIGVFPENGEQEIELLCSEWPHVKAKLLQLF